MKEILLCFVAVAVGLMSAGAIAKHDSDATPSEIKTAIASIASDDLLRHVKVLASDEFEGRAPGTKGDELTVNYLVEQFERLGLKPGSPDYTFTQKVSFVGITSQSSASFSVAGKPLPLKFQDEYVAWTLRQAPEIRVDDSELVFVGYGVVAPEYRWDDYKGLDVKGKTIVMLSGDPQVPILGDSTKLDEKMFKGKAMTYYGMYDYKYEIAVEKGAAAALVVHEDNAAGFSYDALVHGATIENLDLKQNIKRVPVSASVTVAAAKRLFAGAGLDFDTLKRAAANKDFRPVRLGAKVSFRVKNKLREFESRNVIARLDGSDPRLKDECIVYTAHWDHLGRDEKLQGDQIYNGAVDNALGVASLLEIAEAYTKLKTRPKRSVLFLSPTAEESSPYLGTLFYLSHPTFPLERTLANINDDFLIPLGRTKDIILVGYGNSTLDEVLSEAAATQGRRVKPDPWSDQGYFYRSDHLEFAKHGIPVLFPITGTDYVSAPDVARKKRAEYIARIYHHVTDEVQPWWDLSGIVEDTQLLFQTGYRVAQADKYPMWKPGSEFRARRGVMLKRSSM